MVGEGYHPPLSLLGFHGRHVCCYSFSRLAEGTINCDIGKSQCLYSGRKKIQWNNVLHFPSCCYFHPPLTGKKNKGILTPLHHETNISSSSLLNIIHPRLRRLRRIMRRTKQLPLILLQTPQKLHA